MGTVLITAGWVLLLLQQVGSCCYCSTFGSCCYCSRLVLLLLQQVRSCCYCSTLGPVVIAGLAFWCCDRLCPYFSATRSSLLLLQQVRPFCCCSRLCPVVIAAGCVLLLLQQCYFSLLHQVVTFCYCPFVVGAGCVLLLLQQVLPYCYSNRL